MQQSDRVIVVGAGLVAAGAIQGARWALVGAPIAADLIWPSVVVAALLLLSGLFFFKRMEDTFADVI